jgi:hypothetical protein
MGIDENIIHKTIADNRQGVVFSFEAGREANNFLPYKQQHFTV